jgi:hypothetical protein
MSKRTYTVVENAGYTDERDVASFKTLQAADNWLMKQYGAEEVEQLHVMIARDSADGRSYEF